jgi:ADP-heptose:LPS heptosyltransferase
MTQVNKVLVIKLGGLGEMVMAFPAFERIRQAHPRAKIVLLTTEPFAALARSSPFFNTVEDDGRPNGPTAWAALILRLRKARYDRVYDLQNDPTTNLIFQSLRPSPPPWSGTALGCSLPHKNRDRDKMHPLERQAEQLQDAGIWPDAPTRPLSAAPPDAAWIVSRASNPRAVSAAGGHRPMVLLAPGAGAQGTDKRWPVERYADLAGRLNDSGYDVVIIGTLQESGLAHTIQRRAFRARDLTGRTDVAQIASFGARAALAVGNDIAALHLIAAAGAPTIAIFPSSPDPALLAPRGHVTVLHATDLNLLPVEAVARAALTLARAPA